MYLQLSRAIFVKLRALCTAPDDLITFECYFNPPQF